MKRFENEIEKFVLKFVAIAVLVALACIAGYAQSYCRRPSAPSTRYCSTDGDWNDIARCQNDNIDAINRYNREAEEYNECVQQNRDAEQRKAERERQERQEHAQHCSTSPSAYDCR
jgi:hypothetical protein